MELELLHLLEQLAQLVVVALEELVHHHAEPLVLDRLVTVVSLGILVFCIYSPAPHCDAEALPEAPGKNLFNNRVTLIIGEGAL